MNLNEYAIFKYFKNLYSLDALDRGLLVSLGNGNNTNNQSSVFWSVASIRKWDVDLRPRETASEL